VILLEVRRWLKGGAAPASAGVVGISPWAVTAVAIA